MGGQRDLMLNGITAATLHRDSVAAADTGVPDPTPNGDYVENPAAYTVARCFVHLVATSSSGTVTVQLSPWVKRHGQHVIHGRLCEPARFAGGASANYARRHPLLVYLEDEGEGDYWWAFDVPVNGDDLRVDVASVVDGGGGMTAFDVDVYVSWRGSDA